MAGDDDGERGAPTVLAANEVAVAVGVGSLVGKARIATDGAAAIEPWKSAGDKTRPLTFWAAICMTLTKKCMSTTFGPMRYLQGKPKISEIRKGAGRKSGAERRLQGIGGDIASRSDEEGSGYTGRERAGCLLHQTSRRCDSGGRGSCDV